MKLSPALTANAARFEMGLTHCRKKDRNSLFNSWRSNLDYSFGFLLTRSCRDGVLNNNQPHGGILMTKTVAEFPPEYRQRTLATMDGSDNELEEDATLMLRYANGEASAFDLLYSRHKAPLYRYLLRQCRDRAVADDLFQDVWDRVIRSRKQYQVRAKFATFLYRIAHNCAVDQFRQRSRRRDDQAENVEDNSDLLLAPDAERPDRQLADAQFRDAFQIALDNLPAEQRAVFLLYEESGLGLDEIGEITGVGMETAKSRLRYAVSKLRKALADNYRDED